MEADNAMKKEFVPDESNLPKLITTMKLTLACDHRTVDGATGALFLQTLQGFIENPVTMLV